MGRGVTSPCVELVADLRDLHDLHDLHALHDFHDLHHFVTPFCAPFSALFSAPFCALNPINILILISQFCYLVLYTTVCFQFTVIINHRSFSIVIVMQYFTHSIIC